MTAAPQSFQQTSPVVRHTPTPWEASNQYLIAENRNLPIASGLQDFAVNKGGARYDEACANAALIVEAVNSHEVLKARIQELESAMTQIDTLAVCTGVVNPALHEKMLSNIARIARAALSKGAA